MRRSSRSRPVVIGVTGGLASGKSLVTAEFKRLGSEVLDADKIARGMLKKGSAVYRAVIKTFGELVRRRDGDIDRRALAALAFKSRKDVARLNKIVHPAVIRYIKKRIKRSGRGVITIDAPLLIEAGLAGLVDHLIVVKASKARRIRRAVAKLGITKRECLRRMASQMALSKKADLADFVVDNDGTKEAAKRKAKIIWREITNGKK